MAVFLCTCVVVYGMKQPEINRKKPPLKGFLQQVPGYTVLLDIDLEENAFKMLNLDDYIFTDYMGQNGKVNLYIGYYYTADKAYASHSPLVCYPSQGWKIDSQPTANTLQVGPQTINYEWIITSLGERKELVLYWYQAMLQTNTQVYKNKISKYHKRLWW